MFVPFNLIAQRNARDINCRQCGTAGVVEVDRVLHSVPGGVAEGAVRVRYRAAPLGREGCGSLKLVRCFRRVCDESSRRRDAIQATGKTKTGRCDEVSDNVGGTFMYRSTTRAYLVSHVEVDPVDPVVQDLLVLLLRLLLLLLLFSR